MHYYLLIPAVSTLGGLLCGYLARVTILRRLPLLLPEWARMLSPALFNAADIRAALSGKNNFSSISPLVEEHIDEFLNHKLGKEMPMIGMFIGDKTIAQLKAVFMKELEEIFPLVMDRYLEDLSGKLNIDKLVSVKLADPNKKTRTLVSEMVRSRLLMVPFYGALAGLATGIVQDTLLFLLR